MRRVEGEIESDERPRLQVHRQPPCSDFPLFLLRWLKRFGHPEAHRTAAGAKKFSLAQSVKPQRRYWSLTVRLSSGGKGAWAAMTVNASILQGNAAAHAPVKREENKKRFSTESE